MRMNQSEKRMNIENYKLIYRQRCENGKKSKKSNQTKSGFQIHLCCKTEKSKLVKTKPKLLLSRKFTITPQYFTKMDYQHWITIFRSMKIYRKQPMRGSKMEEFSANQNFVFFTLI